MTNIGAEFFMKLYHYTTSNVLMKILSLKEIWFTDFRFLNDMQEFYFAKEIAKNTLNEFNFGNPIDEFKSKFGHGGKNLGSFEKLIDNFKERFVPGVFGRFQNDYVPYVFSLSADGDSLSQWRAYGNGELCIEFDSDKLLQATSGRLHKIEYRSRGDSDEGLSFSIDKFFLEVFEQFKNYGRIDIETIEDGWQDVRPNFLRNSSPIGIKHKGFKDECEWRIVKEYSLRGKGHPETFFDGARYPTPRAKVRLCDDVENLSKIITGVRFGPGSDVTLAKNSIAVLNLAMGTKYEVQFSDIPYRPK